MKNLRFIQLQKENEEHYNLLESLMFPYNMEIDSHQHRETPKQLIQKITYGMLNMQGASDRHLELCYDDDTLIGFLYGKVDHEGHKGFIKPEYGYIMEFYVKSEFRRMGYGKAMYGRLEQLFASHGTRRMYLTADPVTGKPFWESLGFVAMDETSPENGLMIYEKEVQNPKEIITITVSDFLSSQLIENIALMQWHSSEPRFTNSIKHIIYDGKTHSDCFNVIAINAVGEVIGRLYCLKNQSQPHLWYYGDLAVCPDYRRHHIASKMLAAAIESLMNRGCTVLRTYVEPENIPSLNLQAAFGFAEKPYEVFDNLLNEDQLMLEKELSLYFVNPATVDDAQFITMIYGKNADALHGNTIMFDEWKELLSKNDPDEAHFLIHKGAMPCGWLKINGLENTDMAWISMLAAEPKMQHQGIGTYAVKFAEDFIRSKGFSKVGIHTTEDNIPAQNLYKKCGYVITEHGECTTGDGVLRKGYTFMKVLSSDITYKELPPSDIHIDMLLNFNRYQEITKTYRNENGEYVVASNPYTANWDNQRKQEVINDFLNNVTSGGNLFVACDGNHIVGFSLLGNKPLGSQLQYLQLIQLQVSCEYRNKGIGKKLLSLCVDAARNKSCKRIYISANSAFESQAFYRVFGCIEASEIISELFEQEPYDVHMEYEIER